MVVLADNDNAWQAYIATRLWAALASAAMLYAVLPSPSAELAMLQEQRRLVRFLRCGYLPS